ncbi:MAG TPA: dTMP kinase [Nitrososphaeraceae archaeon]|nr:dTMP kinase [Nitrososphaeraceae archaeon]
MRKGRIVVIEGMDKAGKTTQSRVLVSALRNKGKLCASLDFPDYSTPIGREIKSFLDGKRDYPDETKLMLLSANRWERKETIDRMLSNGTILVMNRYYHSNLAYGVSKNLELDWLMTLDRGLPKEDLCIVLEIRPTISESRSKHAGDLFENDKDLLKNVYKNYRKLAKLFNWKIINGERSKEEVSRDILNMVLKFVKI